MLDPGAQHGRVLSIQSHVVSGYVGNKAATFPLQFLGFEVDAINSVQFSNHTGYGYTNGHKTSAAEFQAVFKGLRDNGLISRYTRILTGYIPGAEALKIVAEEVARVRQACPQSVYLLDPVMGDIGRGMYVSEQVIPIYKSMLNLATIVTPNHFELELLSGIKLNSLSALKLALLRLHEEHNVTHVVLSSIALPHTALTALQLPPSPASYTKSLPNPLPPRFEDSASTAPHADHLVCFSSTYLGNGKLSTKAYALPTIRAYYAGVGDLFSAMTLAHFWNNTGASDDSLDRIDRAVSQALFAVQGVLLKTHLHSIQYAGSSHGEASVIPSDDELDSANPTMTDRPGRKAERMRLRELRVIAERSLLVGGADASWPGRAVPFDAPGMNSLSFTA